MRVAVISDIHANLHALEAVVEAIEAESPDAIWCLGDLVGYGPLPNDCCAWAAERTQICLAGNHDLGALDELDLGDFSPDAAEAAHWTRNELTADHRAFLESLDSSAESEGVAMFHASPRDPVWEYVLGEGAAYAAFQATSAPLVLVGHSHVALAFLSSGGAVEGTVTPGGTEIDVSEGRWLLNPGSVGQPRDGDPRAAYLVLDLDAKRALFRRVEYPLERTQEEIRERGLPEPLAARLAHGL